MPPTPGMFPVPYGTAPTHTQSVITTTRPSSAGANHIVGPGVPGPGASTKASRIGGGQLNSFSLSDRDRVIGADGGMINGQEMYGPGIGHGLHSQHQHAHPHVHGAHQHQNQPVAGPSSRHATSGTMEDSLSRKEKKRKESSKLGKEGSDRREDPRQATESIQALHNTAAVLSTRPELSAHYQLRLYPLSLERSALLAQLEAEERYATDCAQVAYDEERERVEEEWKKGRERVRERLLEGIEERRKRAREEKEGEGTVGDVSLDSHTRPPVTRKLRNKLGTSPPPTPHHGTQPLFSITANPLASSISGNSLSSAAANLPITTGPFLNPHSLSVDDLPSPFPMPLTSTNASHSAGGTGAGGVGVNGAGGAGGVGGVGPNGGRRRVKGGGGHQGQAVGGLGKSLLVLNVYKDVDVENDLIEIRRGNKRRRGAVGSAIKG